MAGDGEAGAHSCFWRPSWSVSTSPSTMETNKRLDVKLGSAILVVGKMRGDGDDGGGGLAVQEAAEQSEIVVARRSSGPQRRYDAPR